MYNLESFEVDWVADQIITQEIAEKYDRKCYLVSWDVIDLEGSNHSKPIVPVS